MAIVTPGPNARPLNAASGARSTVARNCTIAAPILKRVAGLEAEPLGDRRIGDRAVDAVARRQRRREILRRVSVTLP